MKTARLTRKCDMVLTDCDGSSSGDQKGMRCGKNVPNAAAAPATVSGESFVTCHWGISVLGRRRRVTPREPGDLPSAVVTREDVGRGVQTLASPGCAKHDGETWFAVTCH